MELLGFLSLLAVGVGCSQDAVAPDVGLPTAAEIRLEPSELLLREGKAASLTVTILDGQGRAMNGAGVSWSSSAPEVARAEEGRVEAIREGSATITARKGDAEATASVRVRSPVEELELAPPTDALGAGESTRVDVTILDDDGDPIPPEWLTWSSSDETVARVDGRGLVTGVGPGQATITARIDGLEDSVQIRVDGEAGDGDAPAPVATVSVSPESASLPEGDTLDLAVALQDSSGKVLDGREVEWSSSDAAVASVDPMGRVIGLSEGTTTITATSEGRSGSATITVVSTAPPPVAQVTVSPVSASVEEGKTLQLSATLQDAEGNVLTGRDVAWSSDDPAVAAVDGSGLVTGHAEGSATITATSEGRSAGAAITVTAPPPPSSSPPPVSQVSVSPGSATVQVGKTVQLAATLQDSSGNVLTDRDVAWSSDDASVATVSSSGRVTGQAAGTATVTATSEGKSAAATITVQAPAPPPVAQVTVSPGSATVDVGESVHLTSTLQDADGNVLTGRDVAWSTDDASVATVSGSGRVTGQAAGTATVTATSEGRSGAATITVRAPAPPPVAQVSVSPGSATVDVGESVQLSATLRDANGNVLTGRGIAWSSDDPTVAAVNGSGLVTGQAAGTATVTATSEGKSAAATITVDAPSPPPSGSRGGWHVTPGGSAAGDGSPSRPWDLGTALAHPSSVQPGDTIWVHAGVYRGEYDGKLRGRPGSPIVVRAVPGDRATISGNTTFGAVLEIGGAYAWYWGLEVRNDQTSDHSTVVYGGTGVAVGAVNQVKTNSPGIKVINTVSHDAVKSGFEWWSQAADGELYGSLSYFNGRRNAPGTDCQRGQGLYGQSTTQLLIAENMFFNMFGCYPVHFYSQSTGLDDITLVGNVAFGGSGGRWFLLGGYVPAQNPVLRSNYLYDVGLDLGWGEWPRSPGTRNARVENNVFIAKVSASGRNVHANSDNQGTVFRGNRVQGTLTGELSRSAFPSNTYYDTKPTSGQWVYVRPNKYEAGRAHVIVYNWDHAGQVSVDLSSVLSPGQAYRIQDAQDFYGPPVAQGTYSGGTVGLPMSGRSVASPTGPFSPPSPVWSSEFGAFVVLPVH